MTGARFCQPRKDRTTSSRSIKYSQFHHSDRPYSPARRHRSRPLICIQGLPTPPAVSEGGRDATRDEAHTRLRSGVANIMTTRPASRSRDFQPESNRRAMVSAEWNNYQLITRAMFTFSEFRGHARTTPWATNKFQRAGERDSQSSQQQISQCQPYHGSLNSIFDAVPQG